MLQLLDINSQHVTNVGHLSSKRTAGILIIYSKELFSGEKGERKRGDIKMGIIDMKSYRSSIKWNT